MKRSFQIGDNAYEASLVRLGTHIRVTFDETQHRVSLRELGGGECLIDVDGQKHRVWRFTHGDETYVHVDGTSWTVEALEPLDALDEGAGDSADTVEAPMPGSVTRVLVQEGDIVSHNQTLIVIESMKMETSIVAWRDGVIDRVYQEVGGAFDRKDPLVSLKPATDSSDS